MSDSIIPARTRVAPSPTGDPHVGTAYMALFDVAWAKKTGGQFVLRFEDTDQNRLVEDSERQIFESLTWLGLNYDEGPDCGGPYGPYRQSERLDTYRPFVDKLIADGHAYYCWCSQERLSQMREEQARHRESVTGYDRLCYGMTESERAKLPGFTDKPVVRMLIPDDIELTFTDLIRGEVKAPRPDDQVILKADGFPTYHLAVVVDDHLMGINTVVRGEEWISSTPKHLLLYKWLGFELPKFAHMPLLRNVDKSKISKRKNPAARLMWFKEEGYLPEALVNFLELLAYPAVNEDEVQSLDEFVATFDWSKVNTVGPVFDVQKLDWLNGVYIRNLPTDELAERIIAYLIESGRWSAEVSEADKEIMRRATPIIQQRLVTLKEAFDKVEFLYVPDDELVIADDAMKLLKPGAGEILDATRRCLADLDEFSAANIEQAMRTTLVDELGLKPRIAFTPPRVAISGQKVSPPLFESIEILGKESTLARLDRLRRLLPEDLA